MGHFPILAALIAALNVLALFAGATVVQIPLFLIATLLAIAGLKNPGVDNPANGRTLSVFAILFAALPFAYPYVRALAFSRAEARRAIETAPTYTKFEQALKQLDADLNGYFDQYGTYPYLEGGEYLPMFDDRGVTRDPAPGTAPTMPPDPFQAGEVLEIFPVGNVGVLVVSVGQDGVRDYPLPTLVLPIDGKPHDPLAPLALVGADLRSLTYDPTNGALSTGDLVGWISRDGTAKNLEDNVWNERLSGYDAESAVRLFEDQDYLATIAATSRAVLNRRPHPNFWQVPELHEVDYWRALALFETGHYRLAADTMLDYLYFRPNDGDAHYWLGIFLWLGGDPDLARRHLAAGFQVEPGSSQNQASADAYDAVRNRQVPALPRPAILDQQLTIETQLQNRGPRPPGTNPNPDDAPLNLRLESPAP